MSHAKRNTSRAVFTSHEREQAKKAWGATSARLNRDSMLPFSACGLCLEPAEDPVACLHGDVFCRECALSNILAQKQEIKRLEKIREHEANVRDEEEQRQDIAAREREVAEFERTLSGAGAAPRLSSSRSSPGRGSPANHLQKEQSNARAGKRKFEMDDQELQRIAAEERAKTRRTLDDEMAAKPKLPSFWTPSITPSSNNSVALHQVTKKIKVDSVCPASPENSPHTYSMATLVTIRFTEEPDERTKGKQRLCPSCQKVLNNASKAMIAKPCGHVVCRSCVDRFMRPSGHHDPHTIDLDPAGLRCYVCEADLEDKAAEDKGEKTTKKKKMKEREKIRPGLVELRSEGTGFSAGGANQVEKVGVSFQC